MAPMVSTVDEAAAFAEQVHALGLAKAGVLVEVPAAALQAARILEVVDFLSIGTNDLSQCNLLTDRMNGELADLPRARWSRARTSPGSRSRPATPQLPGPPWLSGPPEGSGWAVAPEQPDQAGQPGRRGSSSNGA